MPHIANKHLIAACVGSAAVILLATEVRAAKSSTCDAADPTKVLSSVGGDFELSVDPQDPAANLIIVSNIANGASGIAAARVNGLSGQVSPQTLTIIANNFLGEGKINGPEFVQKPTGELGVLYAGPQGVHGVFRGTVPGAWNSFNYDIYGAQVAGGPPALPATSVGAYPGAGMHFGQSTYNEFRGDCTSICVGALDFGTTTDLLPLVTAQGYSGAGAAQAPRDGYVFMSLCDAGGACGLYEAQIDNAGGFVPDAFQKLADVAVAPTHMAAERHPVTGTTVLFANNGTDKIAVWEQPAAGGALNLVAEVGVRKNEHYRVLSDATKLVLHYLGATLLTEGSYTLPVAASGGQLVVGAAKKINSHGHGAEMAYLPAVNKFALYYRSSGVLQRCWVTP